MSKNLTYEYFVRGAFSMNLDTYINRGADPAGLADADIFDASNNQEYFNKAKLGVSYSIASYNHAIFETSTVPASDCNLMQDLLVQSLAAKDSNELFDILTRYTTVRDKYFKFKWQD